VTDVTVTVLDPASELRLHRLTGAFLAGYRNANTRSSCLQQLHRWFAWCTDHQLDPLAVERTGVVVASSDLPGARPSWPRTRRAGGPVTRSALGPPGSCW
jgi:hypothetical protein